MSQENNNGRTPSLMQPPEIVREKHVETIKHILNGEGGPDDPINIQLAKGYDAKWKVGYFRALETPTEAWLDKLITKHPHMIQLKEEVRKLAQVDDACIIYGASGTGKELIAHALHGTREGKFISLNCAGLPEYLIESELFGHAKGAFTGADKETQGLFEIAKDGTLFLDELGELPLVLQAKLLRVLQDKMIRKVGGKEDTKINCRFVAATHQNLPELVKQGKFRLDLYHRLCTFELVTLPLTDRREDIQLIVDSLDTTKTFPKDFKWDWLINHQKLGGNVRTIQSIVRRFQVLNKLPVTQ